MFVNFGSGKCPICGDFGSTVERDVFHCGKCTVSFNSFSFVASKSTEEANRDWN